MTRPTRTCLIGCVLGSFAATAFAQGAAFAQGNDEEEDVPPVSTAPSGQYSVMRGVQGPAGMLSARVLLDVNLSSGLVSKPISLAPDIYYSITDTLQVGILHQGAMGWQAKPGVGLCLTGEDNGCPDLYDNVGFDVMYGLAFGQVHFSTRTTLFVDSFDPAAMSLAVGAAGKVHLAGRVGLLVEPKVAIALLDREVNDDFVYMPVELQFQVGAATTLRLLGGLSGSLQAFGDSYEVPLGLGLVRNLNRHFDLGLRFSFDNLLGHTEPDLDRTDTRSLALLVNIRS
jgi:hypothetical protein